MQTTDSQWLLSSMHSCSCNAGCIFTLQAMQFECWYNKTRLPESSTNIRGDSCSPVCFSTATSSGKTCTSVGGLAESQRSEAARMWRGSAAFSYNLKAYKVLQAEILIQKICYAVRGS